MYNSKETVGALRGSIVRIESPREILAVGVLYHVLGETVGVRSLKGNKKRFARLGSEISVVPALHSDIESVRRG